MLAGGLDLDWPGGDELRASLDAEETAQSFLRATEPHRVCELEEASLRQAIQGVMTVAGCASSAGAAAALREDLEMSHSIVPSGEKGEILVFSLEGGGEIGLRQGAGKWRVASLTAGARARKFPSS